MRSVRPSSQARAGATAAAKRACQLANKVTHARSAASAISASTSETVAPGGFSRNTCLPAVSACQAGIEAHLRRLAHDDRIEIGLAGEHGVQVGIIGQPFGIGIAAGDGDQLGAVRLRNRGQMLIPRNLAETDQPEPQRRHAQRMFEARIVSLSPQNHRRGGAARACPA